MQHLKANTEVIVTVGPFVDVGDGFTPQTDITLGGDEAELIKHGSTAVVDISGATWAAVASCRGYYSLTLTAAHTDTEGLLSVIVQDDSDCLPVKAEYMVLSEAAWDSLYAAKDTGVMSVDVTQVDGTAQRATDLAEIAQYLFATAATLTDVVADSSVLAQMLAAGGDVSDYNNATDSLEALYDKPTPSPPSAAVVADAICDELLAGHTTADSLGAALRDLRDRFMGEHEHDLVTGVITFERVDTTELMTRILTGLENGDGHAAVRWEAPA